jgi:hypothetical protein
MARARGHVCVAGLVGGHQISRAYADKAKLMALQAFRMGQYGPDHSV